MSSLLSQNSNPGRKRTSFYSPKKSATQEIPDVVGHQAPQRFEDEIFAQSFHPPRCASFRQRNRNPFCANHRLLSSKSKPLVPIQEHPFLCSRKQHSVTPLSRAGCQKTQGLFSNAVRPGRGKTDFLFQRLEIFQTLYPLQRGLFPRQNRNEKSVRERNQED